MSDARSNAEIAEDLRAIEQRVNAQRVTDEYFIPNGHVMRMLREAADRLERPRFTAEQLRVVAEAFWLKKMEGDLYPLDAETEILQQRVVEHMRAALSAIGEVEDA